MPPRKGRDIHPGMVRQRRQSVRRVILEVDKTTIEWDDGLTETLGPTDAIVVEDA